LLRELDGAQLHDLGARPGELHEFVVGDFLQLPGGGDDARVGGVDAVHIGEDLAEIRLEGGGEGDGGKVGPAAAEGGDLALGGLALEAGDDDDVAGVEQAVNLPR